MIGKEKNTHHQNESERGMHTLKNADISGRQNSGNTGSPKIGHPCRNSKYRFQFNYGANEGDGKGRSIKLTRNLDFYEDVGHFIEDYTMEIKGEQIECLKIFIASGARPSTPYQRHRQH